MEKVHFEPNSGCWLWAGADNGAGYGTMTLGHAKRAYAHRISFEIHRGPVPDGMHLDHLCRVRCCVNPDHLDPVSNAENARRGKAGHHMKAAPFIGQAHPRSKITDAQAAAIKERAASGESHAALSAAFGVGKGTISHIKTGRRTT